MGGVARRATKISQERANGGFVLLLDAGDSLVGDQDPARKTQGQSSVTLMNMLGYDAMALGPGDLALGPDVLRQRIAEAEFAVLSANAVLSASGEPVATPYVLREFDGYRVAIFGLSGGPGSTEIAVRDPLETARAVVAQVAPQADVVILLSHAGTAIDQQIAGAVPGIDVVISGGKLAAPWRSESTGTFVWHADEASKGHAGRRLGIARLTFDGAGQLIKQEWERLNLLPEIADDPAMARWVQGQMRP